MGGDSDWHEISRSIQFNLSFGTDGVIVLQEWRRSTRERHQLITEYGACGKNLELGSLRQNQTHVKVVVTDMIF